MDQTISTANLSVSSKYIVNGAGQRLFLHGVNYYGPLKCQDGFSNSLPNERTFIYTAAYYERLKTQWNINNIRFMLNEYCWLRNESETDYAGSGSNWRATSTSRTYQQAVIAMVQAARQANLAVIITLGAVRDANFRSDATKKPSLRFGDPSMAAPNELNSRDFWEEVATTFAVSANTLYSGVMLETYNEPTLYLCQNPPGGSINGNQCASDLGCADFFEFDAERSWLCQLHGGMECEVSGEGKGGDGEAAPGNPGDPAHCTIPRPVMSVASGGSGVLGTQDIVDIIRAKSASNVIVVPGIIYSGNIARWEQYKPVDSLTNRLVVSKHNYSFGSGVAGDACPGGNTAAACEALFESVATKPGTTTLVSDTFPVIVTETGTQWEAKPSAVPPDPGDPATDGTSNVAANYNPTTGLCQNQVYVPFILNYVKDNKLAGYNFHEANAIRQPAIGFPPGGNHPTPLAGSLENKPCQNFQLFWDYGEGYDADGVLDNGINGNNTTIEPTKYGVIFKNINNTFEWTYAGGGGSDTTPDPFSFTSVNNVALSSPQASNLVMITGINTATPISVSSGSSYSINGGSYGVNPGTIMNGQNVGVAHFAASTGLTTVTTTLTIGGGSGTFSSTTINADTTPDAFVFTPVSNADTNFAQASSLATINGINAATPISVSAGSSYSINGGPYVVTPGTIMVGQSVGVAHFTAATHSTMVTTTLNIGNVLGTFSSTTRAPGTPPPLDTTPNAFSFNPNTVTNVAVGSTQVSNFTTITGINGNATISVSAGSYDINLSGNFVTAPGTITNNSKVRVAHFAAPTAATTRTTTLTIGGVLGTFSSTTAP